MKLISVLLRMTVKPATGCLKRRYGLERERAALAVLPTDVSAPSPGCVFLGIEGEYITEIQAAVNRINEIRLEACREGVPNPNNGKPLTKADYVPVRWSADLEYIARIRAAESSITMNHIRLNEKPWYDMTGPNGGSSSAEVIAWNSSRTMVCGINQWYEEKADWVSGNPYAVTGHYSSMIDPAHQYVGLASFYRSDLPWFQNTTVGEYSTAQGMNEARGSAVKNCIQTVETASQYLMANSCKVSGNVPEKAGQSGSVYLSMAVRAGSDPTLYQTHNLRVLGAVRWTSSDPSAVSVLADGTVMAKRCGTTVLTGTAANGTSASIRLSIDHNWDGGRVTKEPTISKKGVKTFTCTGCGATRTEKLPIVKLRKGKVYTIGRYRYKLTNASKNGRGTVALAGTTQKKFALTAVNIPGTVKIGGVKFQVTAIENKAFKGYGRLKAVTIGKNVKTIGTEAFCKCKSLKKMTIKSKSLTKVGKNAIKSIEKKAVIRVPSSKRKAYKKLFHSGTGYQKRMKIR
ncbi:leucine-rich repeat protein [Parablautia sp. Marseille-Q6255]|uniref:leucine-rich repeat protein n=1 Tax=Parablautia sp. Marseille-Q6255 TaxID=3039593 RepID=UPI0024BC29EB|nr:leucine-rich repeat protein [Parablautia sp. Marseille-Q6255]